MKFAKKAMTNNKADAVLVKGVQVDRYLIKKEQEQISQGEIEYINTEGFREIYKAKKLEHANKRRLILQALTGINESFRLKASIAEPPVYLANSCNYILESKALSLHVILGLINSKLLNFIFKCKSTSSNVNGYEVDNLPIPKVVDNINLRNIEKLVCRILSLKEKDADAKISKYESQIDKIVYDLYNLDKYDSDIIKKQS